MAAASFGERPGPTENHPNSATRVRRAIVVITAQILRSRGMDASGSPSRYPRPRSILEEGQTTVSSHMIQRVNVCDLVTRSAERFPHREMICDGDRRWSYRDFDAWTNRVAHGLSALGLKKGDALALMSGNRAEFLAVYFACARLGLVCVPINLLWRQHELSHVLTDSRARAAVVEAGLLKQFWAVVESQ